MAFNLYLSLPHPSKQLFKVINIDTKKGVKHAQS